jgi:ferrous iron transport protein A
MSLTDVTDLSTLAPGEMGTVAGLLGGWGLVGRLAALGLTPGGQVTVLQNYGRGPIIVRVRDTRIALGRGEALKVQVRRTTERG